MLAVTLYALVVLAAFELDHHHLLIAALSRDLGLDFAPGHQRGTHFDVGALADQQNLTEFHRIPLFSVQALDSDPVALAGAILFAARSKDRVHLGTLLLGRSLRRREIVVTMSYPVNELWDAETRSLQSRRGGSSADQISPSGHVSGIIV